MVDDYAASTATTGVIAVNGSTSGTIETSNDRDWFAVTLTAGHTYQFKSEGASTGQGTLGYPDLALHDNSGSVVISGAFNGGPTGFTYTATSSGTYYLETWGGNGVGDLGTYKVSATDLSPALAGSIYLTTGNDTIVAPSSGATVYATADTLNAGDRLTGGAGTDVLALSGSGTFHVDQLAAFTGFESITSSPDVDDTTLYLGSQPISVTGFVRNLYLGSGQTTYDASSSGSISFIFSNDNSNWNSANVINGGNYGGAPFGILYLNSSAAANVSYDLTANTLQNIEQLLGFGTNLTLKINSADATGVSIFYGYGYNDQLVTSDATLDLSHSAVHGFTVTSSNAAGTNFTVQDVDTAFLVAGGSGTDTLTAQGFTFSADQRTAIFNSSSIEKIVDPSGMYMSPLVDVTAPGVTASESHSGWTNQTSDLITVTATDAGSGVKSVEIFDNGNDLGAAQLVNGVWTFTAQNLAEGPHAFTATATDNAGNTSAAVSAGAADMVDVTAPTKPGTPVDAAVVNGYVNAAHDTAAQMLTGTAEAGSTVTIYDNNVQLDSVVATNGSWTYQIGALTNGSSHSYTVTATDAAGNISTASDALMYKVDTSAPSAPTALADKGIVNGYVNASNDDETHDVLTGTAEKGSVVTVYDNGSLLGIVAADQSNGAFKFSLGHLADGTHSLSATATDAAGNTGAASKFVFKVDVTAPLPVMTDAVKDSATNLTTFSGTSEANSTVTVYDGKTAVGTVQADASGNWTLKANVSGNTIHSYTESATDLAGNIGKSPGVTLFSPSAHNNMNGGTGNDVLIAGPNDNLTGGGGNDSFVFNPGLGKDVITDFSLDHDTLNFSHTLFTNAQQAIAPYSRCQWQCSHYD
jgi:hypothetical protein